MGQVYVQTTGNAANSGSRDADNALYSGAAATNVGTLVTLVGSTDDLTLLNLSGANQDSIALSGATNSNQKIFWIIAPIDNVAKTITVVGTPTGTLGAWKIGGRMVWTPANVEAALRAGDVVTFNDTPATRTTTYFTARTGGDSTSGFIKLVGKTGVRPLLNVTNTGVVLTLGAQLLIWIENLELNQNGASGNVVTGSGGAITIYNVKISDGGGVGISLTGGGVRVIGCEITGVSGDGINLNNQGVAVIGNYIHDVGAVGVNISNVSPVAQVCYNIIDTCADRGILLSGGAAANSIFYTSIIQNTVYGCGNSGLEITDADNPVLLYNNVFQDNGNAASEYNVEWVAGTAERVGSHGFNCFYLSSGSNNVFGLTVNATEITTDPLFTNPSGGDFSLGSTSPAKATAYPGQFLGGNLGYLDMGAVQMVVGNGLPVGQQCM